LCSRVKMPAALTPQPSSTSVVDQRLIAGGLLQYIPGQYTLNLWRRQQSQRCLVFANTRQYRPIPSLPLRTFCDLSSHSRKIFAKHPHTITTSILSNMRFQPLLSVATFAVVGSTQNTSVPAIPEPPAPGLTFLYTSYAECQNGLYTSQGPRGIRTAIPIIGGNFTGPRLRGLAALI
jgi:hypothetical protein